VSPIPDSLAVPREAPARDLGLEPVMSSTSDPVRVVDSEHDLSRLRAYASVDSEHACRGDRT